MITQSLAIPNRRRKLPGLCVSLCFGVKSATTNFFHRYGKERSRKRSSNREIPASEPGSSEKCSWR